MLPTVTIDVPGGCLVLRPQTEAEMAAAETATGVKPAKLTIAQWIALITQIMGIIGSIFGGGGTPAPAAVAGGKHAPTG